MRKSIALLTSVVFFVGCSTQSPMPSNFKVKATQPDVQGSPSGVPALDVSKIPPPPKFQTPVNDINAVRADEPKLNFDVLPPVEIDTVDGAITVIYRNSHKVRLDKASGKVKSSISDTKELDDILSKNKLIGSTDSSSDKMTDAEMDKMQEDFQAKNNVDIPHLKSIHYYKFPAGTDIKSICKSLSKLPYVRMAYPTGRVVPTMTSTTLGVTNASQTPPAPPSDPALAFSDFDHYWFNQHQIFKAWTIFNSTLPNIAVIDTGFDMNSSELSYGNAYSVQHLSNGNLEVKSTLNGYCPNKTCSQQIVSDSTSPYSHGSMVSSVLAAKKNNNIGGAGVIPNATITPVRTIPTSYLINSIPTLITDVATIAKSIETVAQDPSVDVINLSIGADLEDPNNKNNRITIPISYYADVNTQISYASFTKNKPVVITAGNSLIDPTQINLPLKIPPTLAIVVGGSMTTSPGSKPVSWYTSSSLGSNFDTAGKSNSYYVDMTASARNIGAYAYNPQDGLSTYHTFDGTSFAAPMVSGVLGMMRRVNSSLSSDKLKNIIIYSSNLYRYDSSSTSASARFLGKDLEKTSVNNGGVVGLRDLNAYNALVIARNIGSYSAITRSYNIDDYVGATNATTSNSYSPTYSLDGYGSDIIYGLSSINSGSYLNFQEYNYSYGCAYGYQVYKNDTSPNKFDKMGGVSGVYGSPSVNSSGVTICGQNSWNFPMSYQY